MAKRRASSAPALPPGFPFPCDDARIGHAAAGENFHGRVIGCAVPPAGKRGRFLYVGGTPVPAATVSAALRRHSLVERTGGVMGMRNTTPELHAELRAELDKLRPTRGRVARRVLAGWVSGSKLCPLLVARASRTGSGIDRWIETHWDCASSDQRKLGPKRLAVLHARAVALSGRATPPGSSGWKPPRLAIPWLPQVSHPRTPELAGPAMPGRKSPPVDLSPKGLGALLAKSRGYTGRAGGKFEKMPTTPRGEPVLHMTAGRAVTGFLLDGRSVPLRAGVTGVPAGQHHVTMLGAAGVPLAVATVEVSRDRKSARIGKMQPVRPAAPHQRHATAARTPSQQKHLRSLEREILAMADARNAPRPRSRSRASRPVQPMLPGLAPPCAPRAANPARRGHFPYGYPAW